MISKEEVISLLQANTSKYVTEALGEQALKSDALFLLLTTLIAEKQQPIAWKAAWTLDKATEVHPEQIDLILPWIYDFLMTEEHDGLVRHLMKLLLRRPLIVDKAGLLLDKAFAWVNDEKSSVSKKVHGLQLMFEVYLIYPDFKSELLAVIDDRLERNCSAGFAGVLKKTKNRMIKLDR